MDRLPTLKTFLLLNPASQVPGVWAVLKASPQLELFIALLSRWQSWPRTLLVRRGGWLAWLADPRAGGWGAEGRGAGGEAGQWSVWWERACLSGGLAACCCVAADSWRRPRFPRSLCGPSLLVPPDLCCFLIGVKQQQCALCGVVGRGVLWG